ncbi:MAG: ABC transporter ATP-binding protein [Eubacteriaceae bacterium]|nr:ABC transporter ATP-binding protein [Eubacteriaceae bacterium]
MIELKDLYVSYDGVETVHGVDCSFPEGKISVILGPNGSGKSTTLKAIMRLVPEIRGKIFIGDEDLDSLSQKDLAKRVAYLPQSRNVPDITVSKLVMHGRFPYLSYPRRYRKEDYRIVNEALDWVGLKEYSSRKLENLSGGQRQKAYLAMAMAQDTATIIMDEPTTFLDIKNQFELLDRARILSDMGKTVIMILHDFESTLHYADHVVLMGDGEVRACGSAYDVISSRELRDTFGITPCFYEGDDGLHCYVKPEKE